MPKKVSFEGVEHEFPDDFTDEDVSAALAAYEPPKRDVAERAAQRKAALAEQPGLGRYVWEELKSGVKNIPTAAVGVAKAIQDVPAGMASSTGRSIGGETFTQDDSYAFPSVSDQDIALRTPITRGLGPKKGIAPPLFADQGYGEGGETGPPAGLGAGLDLRDEAAFYRDNARPPRDIEEYQQWLAQQDLATRISPIKDGRYNPNALKNIAGAGAQSIPQMAGIAMASLIGGPAAGFGAGTALGGGNAGADTLDYESRRGFDSPEAGMGAALGGAIGGASEAVPLSRLISGVGAPGFLRRTGTNMLEEAGQEVFQTNLENSTAADPSRRPDLSDPSRFAGDQLETALKAAGPSLGHSVALDGIPAFRDRAMAQRAPADIIEGRDGATGMQPVDMKVPVEKGPSAAVAPNPDRSARVVPADTPVPPGMSSIARADGTVLLYDPATEPSRFALRKRTETPEGLAAYLAERGTPAAEGQPSSSQSSEATAPTGMDEEQYRRVAEEVRQKAIAQDEADALVPLEPLAAEDETRDYLSQLEQQAAPVQTDAATLPVPVGSALPAAPGQPSTSRLDLLYDLRDRGTQLSPEEAQRLDFAIAAEEAKLAPEPLPNQFPEGVPGVEIPGAEGPFAAAQDLLARREALGPVAELPVSGTLQEKPIPRNVIEEAPLETTPPVAPRDLREAALGAFKENPPLEELIRPTGPEPKSSIDVLREMLAVADVPRAARVLAGIPEPKKEGLAARKKRERAAKAEPAPVSDRVVATIPAPKTPEVVVAEKAEREAAKTAQPMMDRVRETQAKAEAKPVPPPIADPKAAEKHTPKQLKAAEQLVVLAYHSERTAEDASRKYAAEREVERAERDARAMGVDVDAISRSVGRETREVTPQVTIETSPFMQARRAAEAAAAKEATPEPKKKASKSRVSAEVEANMLGDVEDAAAGNGNQFQDAAGRLATSERKARTVGINDSAIAAARARGEAKATGKTKKAAKPDTPKTVEKKLAAAVAKEKALRAKRDADPENEALLDEYNEATAELYALTKEANGKGVSTLDVTTDDDTPSLMKTLPQRESRMQAFSQAKTRISPEDFTKALDEVKERLPGIADLIDALDTQAQLDPRVAELANGDRVDAYTQNGRVVIVRENMTSPEHVKVAAIHEAIAHLVPQAVFGKNQWRQKLNDWKAESRWFRDFVTDFAKTKEGQAYHPSELAEEAVAFHAQKVLNEPGYKPPNAYRMFIAKLREWLRSVVGDRKLLGARKLLEFSDRDLAAFLARSEKVAREGLPKNRRKGDARPSFAKSQGVDPQDMADSLTTVTEEPEGGPRTVLGRPERANPGLNREARQAVVAYEHNRDVEVPQRVKDWQEAGERIALEPNAVEKLIDQKESLTPEQVYAAKLLISDEGLASFRDPSRIDKLIRLLDRYVVDGREHARAMRARTDDVLSPADRHRQYIMEALVQDFPESSWKKLIIGGLDTTSDAEAKLANMSRLDRLAARMVPSALKESTGQNETPKDRAVAARQIMGEIKAETGLDLQDPNFDWSSRDNALAVLSYIGAKRASIPAKAFEFWQNNILWGLRTHEINFLSNLMNGFTQFAAIKPLEGLYTDGPAGMTDALAAWKGTMPGIARGLANATYAWSHEVRRSAMLGPDDKFRETLKRTGAMGGKWGKRGRIPYRALLASDELFRGVFGEMEAAATAHGIARKEGLKGAALTARMQELTNDMYSKAWEDNDEIVDEYLFQEKLGIVGKAIVNLRNNVPGLRYIIPFVTTPVNVAKRAFSFTPVAGAAFEVLSHKNDRPGAGLGARIFARQMVGGMMTLATLGMLGDEDDDDPWITGSPVSTALGENKQAERDYQERGGGPMTVKVGPYRVSYARLDPFATTIAAIVDAAHAYRKAKKSGRWGSEVWGAVVKLANQFSDKTFLQNLGTVYKATQNPGEEIPNIAGNVMGGFVPASGLVRQVGRAADPYIREVGVWGKQKPSDVGEDKAHRQARRILFRMMPYAALTEAEPKVSAYGEEYRKGGGDGLSGFAARMLIPMDYRKEQGADERLLDLAIRRMNRRNPGQEYFPPVAQRSVTQGEDEEGDYGEDPVSRKFNQYFSDRELHDLAQARGKAAVEHLTQLIKEYGGKLPTEGRPNTPGFREAFKLGTEEGLQKIGARE